MLHPLVMKLLYLKHWVKNNYCIVSSCIISLNIILLVLLLGSKKEDGDKLIKAITTIITTGARGTILVYTRVFRLYGLYTQLKSDLIVDVADWLYPYMISAES